VRKTTVLDVMRRLLQPKNIMVSSHSRSKVGLQGARHKAEGARLQGPGSWFQVQGSRREP